MFTPTPASATTSESFDLPLVQSVRGYLCCLNRKEKPDSHSKAAWEQFYTSCNNMLRRFIGRQGMQGNDLEDCLQNAWIRLIQNLPHFEYDPSRGAFRTWLFSVAHSSTVDYLRRKGRNRTIAFDQQEWMEPASHEDDSPSYHIEACEADDSAEHLLDRAKDLVSHENFRLMHMRWIEGRSVEETAQSLGISHQQVWYREHRLKKKMRDLLEDHQPAPYPKAA